MADTLSVHLNRREPRTVEVPERFESAGSFELAIRNHGPPAHVHLRLDDALADVATFDAVNHYVEGEDDRVVTVTVGEEFEAVTGTLEVVTAYGAEREAVAVTVTEPPTVAVDEALAEPAGRDDAAPVPSTESLSVAGAAVAAVVGVVLLTALIDETLALGLGLLAVAGAGVAAAYFVSASS